MDWEQFVARRQGAPATRRVPLCADGEALDALHLARQSGDKKAAAAAEEAVAAATMWVTVRALPAADYITLRDKHRPTSPEQLAKGWVFDPDTFPPALVEACLVDGGGFDGFWQSLTAAEQVTLLNVALELNQTVPDLGFIKPDIG